MRREGNIGLLEIHNPPENFLEKPEFIELEKLQEFVESGIKVLVVSGTGRNFSAGADLESLKKQITNINIFKEQLTQANHLLNYISTLEIPVIAAISGVCFGAGLEIALACDIRICDENALFAFPEINHDLIPGLGGTKRLLELTGKSTAIELVLQGDMINAEKALHLRIVDKRVEKKQAIKHSMELAKKMTENRPLQVINAVMKSIRNSKIMNIDEVIKEDAKVFSNLAVDALRNDES